MEQEEFFTGETVPLRGGEYLATILHALEISWVFTLPGSQDLPVLDGIARHSPGIRVIATRNERVSVHIAEGYGKATGRLSVTLPTLGPGIAKEPSGLYSALRSNAPLLSLTPAQPREKLRRIPEVFQGLDPIPLLTPITKRVIRCDSPEELGPLVLEASFLALQPPSGPVHVEIAFPLLFFRNRYPVPRVDAIRKALAERIRPPFSSPPPGVRIGELPPGSSPPPLLSSLQELPSLQPGISLATLPFTLGVSLALPELPVVVIIPEDLLFRSLDTLWLCEELEIPLHLLHDGDHLHRRLSWLPNLRTVPTSFRPPLSPGIYLIIVSHGSLF
jgi:hypothetical protein